MNEPEPFTSLPGPLKPLFVLLILALYLVPIALGVRAAKAKGRSPHWMWFGIHPISGWIAYLWLRFHARPAGPAGSVVRIRSAPMPSIAPTVATGDRAVPAANRGANARAAKKAREGRSASAIQCQLRAEISQAGDAEMVHFLRQLCAAYVNNDRATIERLEPLATMIGEELNRRGGIGQMRRVWELLEGASGSRTLDMHWDGIGEWHG